MQISKERDWKREREEGREGNGREAKEGQTDPRSEGGKKGREGGREGQVRVGRTDWASNYENKANVFRGVRYDAKTKVQRRDVTKKINYGRRK